MSSKSCSRCLGWTTSAKVLLDILNDRSSACEGCVHGADMKLVIEQYQTRRPRWWMVGSTVVVPIWMVELLRKRKNI